MSVNVPKEGDGVKVVPRNAAGNIFFLSITVQTTHDVYRELHFALSLVPLSYYCINPTVVENKVKGIKHF